VKEMPSRVDPPRRQRGAREDASVGSIERHIEKSYNVPKGSVKISNPSGTDARSDQKIGTLKKKFGE
jgi:hypothetical protein